MSTRATYQFINKNPNSSIAPRSTTIYIHSDGYLSGAAAHLWSIFEGGKGCMASRLLKNDEGAELTNSHEAHGDTEFQYTITGDGAAAQLVAVAVSHDWQNDRETKQMVYSGPLYQFISDNREYIEEIGPLFAEYKNEYENTRIISKHDARRAIDSALSNLLSWKGRFEGSANWNGQVKTLELTLAAFPALREEYAEKGREIIQDIENKINKLAEGIY